MGEKKKLLDVGCCHRSKIGVRNMTTICVKMFHILLDFVLMKE